MNFPDLIVMTNEDDSSPTPNEFSFSNPSMNISQTKMSDDSKSKVLYKCTLCQKLPVNQYFTCSTCINTGAFCSSKSDLYSTTERETLLNMLNKDDYEELEKYSSENLMPILKYSDRKFLLEQFNAKKTILETEFQRKLQASIKTRQMIEEIQLRKNHFKLIYYLSGKIREEIEQKKQKNKKTQENIDNIRSRIRCMRAKISDIKINMSKPQNIETNKKIEVRTEIEKDLQKIRQIRLNQLMKYVIPIRRVEADEDALVTRMRAIKNALKAFDNNVDDDDRDDEPITLEDRYQIINSFLPMNGDYNIENLVSIYNSAINDSYSSGFSTSSELYETLAGLSYACQLINIVAFFLDIKLPFYLHHWEFNKDDIIVDDLRGDIAKLNANIICCCLSQGISIDSKNVSNTLGNLFKLLTLPEYSTRPNSFIFSEDHVNMLEKEVVDVKRALTTSYWFDDDDDDKIKRKDEIEIFDDNEWDLVPINELTENNSVTTIQRSDPSLSTSDQHKLSVMSTSIGFIKSWFGGS